ncbi:MAG: membrane protein insertion efficiency factor YidD [Bacteroidota bacterium]
MKPLILFSIKLYWKLIPVSKRRKCIFHVSCSNFVFDETNCKGTIAGIKALIYRYRTCRSGHLCYLNPLTNEIEMVLITGEVIPKDQIAGRLLVLHHV